MSTHCNQLVNVLQSPMTNGYVVCYVCVCVVCMWARRVVFRVLNFLSFKNSGAEEKPRWLVVDCRPSRAGFFAADFRQWMGLKHTKTTRIHRRIGASWRNKSQRARNKKHSMGRRAGAGGSARFVNLSAVSCCITETRSSLLAEILSDWLESLSLISCIWMQSPSNTWV